MPVPQSSPSRQRADGGCQCAPAARPRPPRAARQAELEMHICLWRLLIFTQGREPYFKEPTINFAFAIYTTANVPN